MRKLSVRSRLTLWYIGSICVLIAVFFIYTYLNFSHAIYSDDMSAKFDVMLLRYTRNISEKIALRYGPFYRPIHDFSSDFDSMIGEDFFLHSAYGQLVNYPERFGADPLVIIKNTALGDRFIPLTAEAFGAISSGKHAVEAMYNVFPFPVRVISMEVKDRLGHRYILQIGMSLEPINTTLENVVLKFLLVWPVLLVIISVMGYIFMKRSFAPVKEIVATTRSITAEDLSRRIVSVESDDEIGELVETLNDMISRLEQSFIRISQFSDDVSHELKTPLTIIRGELEVALRGERSAGEYRETLVSLHEEVDKLADIIEDLFLLSRIDVKKKKFRLRETALDQVVLEAFEETSRLASERGVTLHVGNVDSAAVNGEPGLLKRVFINLIHNAVKYTPKGGTVDVALYSTSRSGKGSRETAEFTIQDTGIGIPKRHIPFIYDRFYRVDKSRSLKTGGKGLGLTLVKKIVDLHGGTIDVESIKGRGTVFFINFPKINKN